MITKWEEKSWGWKGLSRNGAIEERKGYMKMPEGRLLFSKLFKIKLVLKYFQNQKKISNGFKPLLVIYFLGQNIIFRVLTNRNKSF